MPKLQEQVLAVIQKVAPKIVTFKWRSPKWRQVRKAYLADHPRCECCNAERKIEVHHIRPFHIFPNLELRKFNLISLCDDRCHLVVGHLGSYKSFNHTVRADSRYILKKVFNRTGGQDD
jgi:5-methylcytosine-specific restriction protein A